MRHLPAQIQGSGLGRIGRVVIETPGDYEKRTNLVRFSFVDSKTVPIGTLLKRGQSCRVVWLAFPFHHFNRLSPAPQDFRSKNGLFPVMLKGMPRANLTLLPNKSVAKPARPTENISRVSTRESAATLAAELAAMPRSMELNVQTPFVFSISVQVP